MRNAAAQKRTNQNKKIKKKRETAPRPSLLQRLGDWSVVQFIAAPFQGATTRIQNLVIIPPDPWGGSTSAGRDLVQGKLRHAGQSFLLTAHYWQPDAAGPDWLTAAHSFEWLRDLRALGGDNARRAARLLVKDWLQHYKRWDPLAWRPDIVGARLSAWISLHDFFLASADDGYRQAVFSAIQKQSRYLTRVLPGQLRGSRLITAIKGQILASLALPQAQPRLFQALALLHDELNRQILPDGGHVERNPSTHAQVLKHLLDIRAALRCAGLAIPESVNQAIHAMAPVLRFYCHGDGLLTHMNGGSENDSGLVETILQQAHATTKAPMSLPYTGYERLAMGRSLVIMDVGTAPLHGYDAQLHAAPLAFEFSVARERLFVNCGHGGTVCQALPLSLALRFTAAHSAAVVSNTNAVELRPEGGIGRHPKTIHLHQEQTREQMMLAATHDGYHSNLGVVHTRRLYLAEAGEDLRGQDSFVGSAGHRFTVRFHLHPDVRASVTGGKNGNSSAVLLRTRSGAGWRFRVTGAEVELEESIYVTGVGEKPKKTTQIVLRAHTTEQEKTVKWRLSREKKVRAAPEQTPSFAF